MLVISSPVRVANEFEIIHKLFEAGLPLFHIRKPGFTIVEMQHYLEQLPVSFRDKLVLHQHHELADTFGIHRIHIKEQERSLFTPNFTPNFTPDVTPDVTPDRLSKPVRCTTCYTTSVHTIATFNNLPEYYQYAFLSPVFESISKPGYPSTENLLEAVKKRTNKNTLLIALGGITATNTSIVLEHGFDGIALMGSIWNSDNPVADFRKCRDQRNTILNPK